MDSRIDAQDRTPTVETGPISCRTVSFVKVEAEQPTNHEPSVTAEEFEIGIGSWRAKIVKQLDGNVGRPRFKTRFDAAPREVWARRRLRRLADRLNARRRLSD